MTETTEKSVRYDYKIAREALNRFQDELGTLPVEDVFRSFGEALRPSRLVCAGPIFDYQEDGSVASSKGFRSKNTGRWLSTAYLVDKDNFHAQLEKAGKTVTFAKALPWSECPPEIADGVSGKFPKSGGFTPTHVVAYFFDNETKYTAPMFGVIGVYENPKNGFVPMTRTEEDEGIPRSLVLLGALVLDQDKFLGEILEVPEFKGAYKRKTTKEAPVEEKKSSVSVAEPREVKPLAEEEKKGVLEDFMGDLFV